MICREYEARWNEVLDARSDGWPKLSGQLETHVATCEDCQAISSRYQLLRQAVSAWGPPPVASASSVERLRRLSVAPRPIKFVKRRRTWVVSMATAAAVFALAWIGRAWWTGSTPPKNVEIVTIAKPATSRPIELAFEEATSATIDLALEASAPAARIGRDVLSFEEPVARENPSAADPSTISATDVLQTMSERVKPISGSARHAFSFLLGPPPGPDRRSTESRDLTQ